MPEGRRLDLPTIVIILIILLLLNVGGIGTKFSDWLQSEAKGAINQSVPECLHDRVTMTVGRLSDIYTSSNDVSDLYTRVYINNQDRGLSLDGTTITTTYNDKIDLYYAINSTNYYASKDSFNVPCASAFASSELGEAYRLYKSSNEDDTNISAGWKCYNPVDDTLITDSANVSISTGNYYYIQCEIAAIPSEAFSPMGPAEICFDYQSANFSEPVIITDAKTTNPANFITPKYDSDLHCFEIESIKDKKVYYRIQLKAANDYPGEIKQYLVDKDWFRHSKTLEMILDKQNDLNEDVGSRYEVTNRVILN